MAYDKKELIKLSVKAVEENNICCVSYIASYLPCSLSTFYDLELQKSEDIKEALYKNRSSAKIDIVNRIMKSDNPTCLAMALKILGDKEDNVRNLLADKQEVTHDGKAFSLFFEKVKEKSEKLEDDSKS